MRKILTLILVLCLMSTTLVFGNTLTKPETLDINFTQNNDTFIASNNGEYGYKIKTWSDNGTPVTTLYLKNFETNEVKELFQAVTPRLTLEDITAYWSKDNILLYVYMDNTGDYIDQAVAYDPTTDITTVIDNNTYQAVYYEPEDCFITPLYRYHLDTGVKDNISYAKYYAYLDLYYKFINIPEGEKPFTFYIDDVKIKESINFTTNRNSLYVPSTFFSDYLGCEVSTTPTTATLSKDGDTVVFTVDKNTYTVNDEVYYSDFQPQQADNDLYLPFSMTCKMFGYDVLAFEGTYRICLTSNSQKIFTTALNDNNSDVTLSPNGEYGFMTTRYSSHEDVVYFKNMKTNDFKELYKTTGHYNAYWTDTNKLIMSGSEYINDSSTSSEYFKIYDPETDEISLIVNAYYGRYIPVEGFFVYSTTEYRSDATTDEGSSFYIRDLDTLKDTEISQAQYYKYIYYDNQEKYEYVMDVWGLTEEDLQLHNSFVTWIIEVYNSIINFFTTQF